MSHEDTSLESLLALSVELAQTLKEAEMNAAIERHPSASGDIPGTVLTATDRCDSACTAAALYRVGKFGYPEGIDLEDDAVVFNQTLDFCSHHWSKNMPKMADQGWRVIGTNPELIEAMYGDRTKGDDHA